MSVKIIKNLEQPETTEILAEAIIKIGEAVDRFQKSNLTESALVTLLADMPNSPGKPAIRAVLENLKTLKGYYLRK